MAVPQGHLVTRRAQYASHFHEHGTVEIPGISQPPAAFNIDASLRDGAELQG
jgi:hypothetical protein